MRANHLIPAALVLLAAACSDSGTDAPQRVDALTTDAALVAGQAAFEDVSVMYAQVGEYNFQTGSIAMIPDWHRQCPYDAGSGRFVCPTVTVNGRTMSRSWALTDAAGGAQSAYDPVTTASVNFRSTFSSDVARDGWTATMSHERDMTVSGLAGAETQHTTNGVASSEQFRSHHRDGVERAYSMSSVATFSNVVTPVPRARGAWPLSGTITRVITATREGAARAGQHTRTTTTTFNGTRFATLTVGDRVFTLDLATGRVVRR